MHATEFLKQPAKQETGPLVALFGPERHLKQAALKVLKRLVLGPDDEMGVSRFSGKDLDLKTVRDELRLVSMWGNCRLVVVEEAEDFVSENRAGLEKYLDQPAKKSVLVLDVKSWPKNTRLAKALGKVGLAIECSELKGGALLKWVCETAKEKFDKQISREAAQVLTQLAGTHLGLLDQELSKLTAYVGDRPRIQPEDVRTLVGGWKAETTWAMTNAVRDGNLEGALTNLDKLLVAGEPPQKILGGIIFVFRKLAHATDLAAQGRPLNAALQQAGVFPRDVSPSETYLRRIGRPRAEELYHRLFSADGNLKGQSRLPFRTQLEQLLVQISGRL